MTDLKLLGMGAALASAASWAIGSILFKRIGETVTPFGMTLSKGAVSSLLLGGVLFATGYGDLPGEALGLLLLSGMLGIAIGDTLFFAALQDLGGGTWGGCVFDTDRILEVIAAGRRALGGSL